MKKIFKSFIKFKFGIDVEIKNLKTSVDSYDNTSWLVYTGNKNYYTIQDQEISGIIDCFVRGDKIDNILNDNK